MRILCDTNILLRTVSPDSPDHALALESLAKLRRAGKVPVLVPQCIYEFYVAATRPANQNGLGMSPEVASSFIDDLLEVFPLLRDERTIFERWKKLVEDFQVSGKTAHDARLMAAMNRHSVETILTFNDRDFKRYDGIIVLTPAQTSIE
jgi:predicted nucleic acid-binding protein